MTSFVGEGAGDASEAEICHAKSPRRLREAERRQVCPRWPWSLNAGSRRLTGGSLGRQSGRCGEEQHLLRSPDLGKSKTEHGRRAGVGVERAQAGD